MKRRATVRALLAGAAVACSFGLIACNGQDNRTSSGARAEAVTQAEERELARQSFDESVQNLISLAEDISSEADARAERIALAASQTAATERLAHSQRWSFDCLSASCVRQMRTEQNEIIAREIAASERSVAILERIAAPVGEVVLALQHAQFAEQSSTVWDVDTGSGSDSESNDGLPTYLSEVDALQATVEEAIELIGREEAWSTDEHSAYQLQLAAVVNRLTPARLQMQSHWPTSSDQETGAP